MFALRKQALEAILQGIDYLYLQQQKDGSFLSFSSPNPQDFANALQFHSTFSTSLILDSLCTHTQTQQLHRIKQKAASFLLGQKSTYWSFNYWARNSKQAKQLPYPDDLDDTSCALAALFHYDSKIIDGSVLAHVVRLLTASEIKEGGPYRTWLVVDTANKVWKDIDVAVNSNVAYFLSLQEIELPQLTSYIEDCIVNNKLLSPYYPTDYPIIYFISRFYNGKYKDALIKILLTKKTSEHNWDNPLNTALAISAIINLQGPVDKLDKSVLYLLQTQIEGSWKPDPFYAGVNPKKDKPYFAGSSTLTTAFCLEALNKYFHLLVTEKKEKQAESAIKKTLLHKQIMQTVEKRFLFLDKTTQQNAFSTLDTIIKNDSQQQVTLLSYYFVNMLGDKKKKISDDFIAKLGMANVFGWLAYTIYDDFLDEEGDPRLLSIANIALRTVSEVYENILPKHTKFTQTFHGIMDTLDSTNAWEAANCRVTINNNRFDLENFIIPDFRNFERLAEKSLGHALGPVAILFSLGYTKQSPEMKSLLLFFKHYLIARQLNDDAHDWEKDLLKGYCNSVGSLLLEKYRRELSKNKESIVMGKHIKRLQKIFWYEVIVEVCSLINQHTQIARDALNSCSVIAEHHLLDQLLIPHEKAARIALDERKNALKFLQTYTSLGN